MVSIVIVSHSASLAEGVRELADQMVQGKVPIATAGGISDQDNPIGTDAQKVFEAISSVYTEDGVVVLMDLGSALLSTELALEFLPSEQQKNVYLSEAPLVEGTLAAAVQASVGSSIEQVLAEARGALAVKANQLQPSGEEEPRESAPSELEGDIQELRLVVANRLGLHARPAARFVTAANQYEAELIVFKGNQSANAKSINQVATLGVVQGDEIIIRASGSDAAAALASIHSLADENFGDDDSILTEIPSPPPLDLGTVIPGKIQGIAASPGIAVGPVVQFRWQLPEVTRQESDNPKAEWRRLQDAIRASQSEIEDLHSLATGQMGSSEAAIFEAHLLFLTDPALVEEAKSQIFDQRINAEAAWRDAVEEIADAYEKLEDGYMQARASDVRDVGNRVLQHLMAVERSTIEITVPSILVASDLTPSDTTGLDPERILGICTELGGATSHSAILARALGIPAVVGLGPALESLPENQVIVTDGSQGLVILEPSEEEIQDYRDKREAWIESTEKAKAASQKPAITQDGRRIEIAANIGSYKDAAAALEFGAEGVGLFRTEFLFLDRDDLPGEEEQYEVYHEAAKLMAKRPLIIRTLDVGGDKPLPYLDMGRNDNPFLGKRGVRFYLDQADIYQPQLRAILRASYGHNVKVMFPMISTIDELRRVKELLAEAGNGLKAEGTRIDEEMEVGIMIEVPAAVAMSDKLAEEVDFFSIGSNDLTQYVMAADRGDAQVSNLANALQPAVLRLIYQTAQAAHRAGIWVGLCGELAANHLAAPLLVGLGLDELSMNSRSIPAVKTAIQSVSTVEADEMARQVLALDSAGAVEAFLASQ